MTYLPVLQPEDHVEIIAPASRCSDEELTELTKLLQSWNLNCAINPKIFGKDLLCSNSDEERFNHLKLALTNPQCRAIVCTRGGYGSLRLIPQLATLEAPSVPKLLIGMSDITALHLFLQQQWNWPTLHGALSPVRFSQESLIAHHRYLFENKTLQYHSLMPLNEPAKLKQVVNGEIIGGNLTIVLSSLGTPWAIKTENKILFLEEINERGYRIDRMIEQLNQANKFNNIKAIILGDFLGGLEPDGSSLVGSVLQRLAHNTSVPVLRIANIGHGTTNYPLPLGVPAQLELGSSNHLIIAR